jgi:hypothetical protein
MTYQAIPIASIILLLAFSIEHIGATLDFLILLGYWTDLSSLASLHA